MKQLISEARKSQEQSKPVQTTRYEPKAKEKLMRERAYSNTKNARKNSFE